MSYTDIAYARRDGVATITLNRPERRNPIGGHTIGELLHALKVAREDAAVDVVVITGAGQVFSAGGDLSTFQTSPSERPLVAENGPFSVAGTFVDLNLAFTRLQKPSIAMVNGHALAGGLGLMLACDLAIASDHAMFAAPEINVGLWPMMITATLFRHVPRKRGLELILTGERVDAREAVSLGLITRAVPRDQLQAEVDALCEKISSKSPRILQLGLAAFYASQDMPFEESLRFLEDRLVDVLHTEDSVEGRQAFLQKRAPEWKGR